MAPVPSLPWRDPLEAFWPLRDEPFALLLPGAGAAARWTGLFAHPRDSRLFPAACEALRVARDWLDQITPALGPEGSPFRTGVAGVLGYDGGDSGDPDLTGAGLYDLVLVFDHQERQVHLLESPGAEAGRRSALLSLLEVPPPPAAARGAGRMTDNEPREAFGLKVEAVRSRIACGEFYQANISRRFEGQLGDGDHPFDLFRRLAGGSPAAFSAYVRLPGCAIVSNSPERLVRVQARAGGRVALASPIKGTAPRGATPCEDEGQASALLASAKDRAENLMIVDLMRNDLSITCRPGTVRTPVLFELSTLPNVHHLVSHVEGVLREDCSAIDLLASCFPAGSITGAPKRRAMAAIREIEGGPRGADYGSVFWAGADGELDASVLIRTATCREQPGGWSAAFRVGCGITWDSDPDAETLETEAKAERLLLAIRGAGT